MSTRRSFAIRRRRWIASTRRGGRNSIALGEVRDAASGSTLREEFGFLKLPPTLEESTRPNGSGQAFKGFWVRLGANALEQASPELYRRLVCASEEFV